MQSDSKLQRPVAVKDKSDVSEDEMRPEVDDDHVRTMKTKQAARVMSQRSRSSSKSKADQIMAEHVSSKQSVQSEKTEKTLPIDAPTQLIRKPEESKKPAIK
jgi:hypothetical protein